MICHLPTPSTSTAIGAQESLYNDALQKIFSNDTFSIYIKLF